MAVELELLYEEIRSKYNIQLLTESCFGKQIDWVHVVESEDLIPMLHGNELVFNSGLNYTSEEWLREFIDLLMEMHVGGLVIGIIENTAFSEPFLSYCNEKRFPLFSATWDVFYIDVMRKFSEMLLDDEKRQTNLVAALKNAIYYPENEDMYLNHFERNGYFRDMSYTVVILSCYDYEDASGNERLTQIERTLKQTFRKSVIYEEKGRLIILAAGYSIQHLWYEFMKICGDDPGVYVGIGQTVEQLHSVHDSYESAFTAYQLTKTTIPKNLLCYDDLGIYKLLAIGRGQPAYRDYVRESLGELIDYDREHDTDYMKILEAFFENDCSILETSKAIYCHKNTLAYKINAIKDILGYNIMTNENRFRIMLSLYILRMGRDYF